MASIIPRPPRPTENTEEGLAVLQENALELIDGMEQRVTSLGDAQRITLTLACLVGLGLLVSSARPAIG